MPYRLVAISLADLLLGAAPLPSQQETSATYFPPRGEWQRKKPSEVGMSAERLEAAVQFAKKNETPDNRDLGPWIDKTFGHEPLYERIGPAEPRGPMSGLVIRKGAIVAEWGALDRPEMTFSVTKTYLSTVVGLAFDEKLIADFHAPMMHRLGPGPYWSSPHTKLISWDHLLRQTSDWRGTLFERPAWTDRPPRNATLDEMKSVPLRRPGEAWEYNDVRVNLLALAALQVWREPLPRVLKNKVMDPIGASTTWRWHGYRNSWVEIDGLKMQSVSGGGHWGGGMFVSTLDQARFGYLFLRDGKWRDRQIVSKEWLKLARTPTKSNPGYGHMNWFLNTERKGRNGETSRPMPFAPADAVTFRGAGTNIVYVDRENDLLVVVRWIGRRAVNGFLQRVVAALD